MCKQGSFSASISRRPGVWWQRRGRNPAPLTLLVVLVPILVLFQGCTSVESIAPSVARIPVPGNTAVLTQGRQIYLGQCTACHVAEPVAKYSAGQWPGIIREMAVETKLSADEERAVLAYVMAALRAPVVP